MTAPTSDHSGVTLVTRSSCQLCIPAREIVERVCAQTGRAWAELRIDGDAELTAEFGDRVPVVLVDGEEIASLMIDEQDLAAVLRA